MLTVSPSTSLFALGASGSSTFDVIVGFFGWLGQVIAGFWGWMGSQSLPLSALAAIVTAVIAVIALNRTSRDSHDRSRPVVLAYFRAAEQNDRAFDFVVRNYGPSAARDVALTFDPPFNDEQRKDRMTEIVAQRWDKSMPLLPPGAEIKNLWWSTRPGPGGGEVGAHNALETPDEVTVTITYCGSGKDQYTETIPLDGRWMKLDSSSVSSDSTRGRMKQIAEALGKVATETRSSRFLLRDIAEAAEALQAEKKTLTWEDMLAIVKEKTGATDAQVLTDDELQRLLAAFGEDGSVDGARAKIEAGAAPEPESEPGPEVPTPSACD